MRKTILSAITFLYMASGGYAGGFTLDSVSVSDLKGYDNAAVTAVPVPARPAAYGSLAGITKSPNMAPALDMSLKLPYAELNKRMAGICDDIKVIDQTVPVLSRQGDHIVFTNVTVNFHGMDVEPTVQIQPAFEGNNRLAIRFSKVDADVSFGPKGLGSINKDDLMATIAESLTASMLESMDAAFTANRVQIRAKHILSFTYDKASWTLRASISPDFVAPLLPGLISNISLTSFSFDDKGFTLSVKSASAASIAQLPGFNLALSDGLLTNFMRSKCAGSDYDLAPQGHDGGIKFRADGRMEVALKAHMRSMTFQPNVYAVIELTPTLTAPDTIVVRFEKVTIDQAYGIGIPGFISNMLQGSAISGVVSGIMTSPDLAQVMSARKLDDKTLELKLKNNAFLPSFAKGVIVRKMMVKQGLMYLGFEF